MTLPRFSAFFLPACVLAAALALGALPPWRLLGATPAPPVAVTHVRVWKTELHDFPVLRVTVTPQTGSPKQHPTAHDLGNLGPGYMFNGYIDVPAGRGTLDAYDAPAAAAKGPAPRPLVSMPVDFAPGAFVTVLLDEPQQAKGPPHLESIVDDIDDPAVAQLTVRGLGPGAKDVHVTVGDTLSAQFVGSGGYLQMRGLRPAPYTARTYGTHPDGKPFDWTTSLDLKQHPHQTLLIYADPYGHIRPRLSVDGESPAIQPEDKEHGH